MSEDDRIGNFLSDSDRVKASKNKQTNKPKTKHHFYLEFPKIKTNLSP